MNQPTNKQVPDRNYERLLVGIARQLFDYIYNTNSVEALRTLSESKLFDALLDDWDNYQWPYHVDPPGYHPGSYLGDFTLNFGEWPGLKISMLKPTKRQIREGTGISPGAIEGFAEDVRRVLVYLEAELLSAKDEPSNS